VKQVRRNDAVLSFNHLSLDEFGATLAADLRTVVWPKIEDDRQIRPPLMHDLLMIYPVLDNRKIDNYKSLWSPILL
jgi:hypothetical protein